jgi:glycosyltransferase involved in cell wall biosynthesis
VAELRATIIVPLLRQQDAWLAQAIRSALAQTVPCEVLVVVAPGTPPGNRRVLDRLQAEAPDRMRVVTARTGFPVQLNAGIASATTKRIGLLLSDDWLAPSAVEACLPSPADIVSTGMQFHRADGAELVHIQRRLTMDRFRQLGTLEAQASCLSHFFLFDRRKLEEVGGLDESLGDAPGIDDYDLIWVLLERGATVHIVEQDLYHYRDHEEERLTLRPQAELLVTLGRILDKHGVTGAERERLLTAQARWLGRPIHVVKAELDRGGH